MKRNFVAPNDLRDALAKHGYAGLPLANLSIAQLYATVLTTPINIPSTINLQNSATSSATSSLTSPPTPPSSSASTTTKTATTSSSSSSPPPPITPNTNTTTNTNTPSVSIKPTLPSSAPDWAFISYVNTESAIASKGMPSWLAADAQSVLDELYRLGLVSTRAVYFDRLASLHYPPFTTTINPVIQQQTTIQTSARWPSILTLQLLSVPVICVPPTRTLEYSRYQIPPQWSPSTSDYYTKLELLMRQCNHCVHRTPLEYDPRLLNIAATLRAWPIIEAIIASNARGAFISFATLDRFRYTLAWYQTLLKLSIRIFTNRHGSNTGMGNGHDDDDNIDIGLGGIGTGHLRNDDDDDDDEGDELFGPALFKPCRRCVVFAARLSRDEQLAVHIDALEESLAALVAHVQRFCLPVARPGEIRDLWSLQGAFRSSGERNVSEFLSFPSSTTSPSPYSLVSNSNSFVQQPQQKLSQLHNEQHQHQQQQQQPRQKHQRRRDVQGDLDDIVVGDNEDEDEDDDFESHNENAIRLEMLACNVISQKQFEHIASGIVSGRVSLAPCYNHSDKWLCGLILANIGLFLSALQDHSPGTFPITCRSLILVILRSEKPFGSIRPRENIFNQYEGISPVPSDSNSGSNNDRAGVTTVHNNNAASVDVVGRCMRCPPCDGCIDSVCFVSELSGTLSPKSMTRLLLTWGVKHPKIRKVLSICESKLWRRLHKWSVAFESYEFELADLTTYNKGQCIHCRRAYSRSEQYYVPLLLLCWTTKQLTYNDVNVNAHSNANKKSINVNSTGIRQQQQQQRNQSVNEDGVGRNINKITEADIDDDDDMDERYGAASSAYTFVTFDVEDSKHLWSKGMFKLDDAKQCKLCRTFFTRAKVHDTGDSLEIHTNVTIPITNALRLVIDALRLSHQA